MSRVEQKQALDLNRIIFIGRTWDEYLSMFKLSVEELDGRRVLDCPGGACSFTAVATQKGLNVTAADLAYFHQVEDLQTKGLLDIEHAMEGLEKSKQNYVWDFFGTVSNLKATRIQALEQCVQDMKQDESDGRSKRYVPCILPELPFEDGEFDFTLSAHFLFMYGDRLDFDFHVQTIRELMRVTREEIRIFPTVDIFSNRYAHMDELLEWIEQQGFTYEEVEVPYEFQRDANRMLVLKRSANANPMD